jgi:FemAB-related protein (PEP-CTERM system-associated)
MQDTDRDAWDRFAAAREPSCLYQLSAWKDVIARSYSLETQYIVASTPTDNTMPERPLATATRGTGTLNHDVVGVLPMAHVQHWLFGNSLVSLPYCDAAGVLAATPAVERALVAHCLRLADVIGVPTVELRQCRPLACVADPRFVAEATASGEREVHAVPGWRVARANDANKVRMVLALPESADALLQSFKAKLRNQIRKPLKDGLSVRVDGADLIDDFYAVFAENMRDLGSPVHSKRMMRETLASFPDDARIFVVYGHGVPMAASITLSCNGVLANPWASSLRQYSREAPNMLLYWAMLEYACAQRCTLFDFGRSTVDAGT